MEKMTRKEAIFELIKLRRRLEKDSTIDAEPFDMAIEALEEAKKREGTWEWCTDCKEYDQENHCCHRLNNVIYDTLCGTIVSGEWLYKEMKGQFCSVCGKQSVWKFDFCPNCGADMREERG